MINLFKTIKRKKSYLNDNAKSGGYYDNLENGMFCASCEKAFKIKDYLVRLKFNNGKFDEVITCSNPDCEGDESLWIEPGVALGILSEIYECDDLNPKEKEHYKRLVELMTYIVQTEE